MLLYTISGGEVLAGWVVDQTVGQSPAVILGEEGRGRVRVRLPLVDAAGAFLAEFPTTPCPGRDGRKIGYSCPNCGETGIYVPSGPCGGAVELVTSPPSYAGGEPLVHGRCSTGHNVGMATAGGGYATQVRASEVASGEWFPTPDHKGEDGHYVHPTDRGVIPAIGVRRKQGAGFAIRSGGLDQRGRVWCVAPMDPTRSGPHPEGMVALIIRDHSGYRGSWDLLGARTPSSCSRAGQPEESSYATCPECRERPVQKDGGSYTHRRFAYGPAPEILAQGLCADGAAGRMGSGGEYMLVLAPGEEIWISASGRRALPLTRIRNDGGKPVARTIAQVREEEAGAAAPARSF